MGDAYEVMTALTPTDWRAESRRLTAEVERLRALLDPERIERVLRENDVGEVGGYLHSWRCSYPEQYGPCACLAELVADLTGGSP